MTLDIEGAPSQEEIAAVNEHGSNRIRQWKTRSFYAGISFLLSVGIDIPFSAGMPLHKHWNTVSGVLFLVTMASFLAAVYCSGLWWGAWSQLREFKKTYS
jgi:hypothetical protein